VIRLAAAAAHALAWVFTVAAVLLSVLWGVGRVLTDTVPSLQQLHWIPTVVALTVTVLALVLAALCVRSTAQRKWRNALWIIACLQAAVLLLQDWRPLTSPIVVTAGTTPIRISHVNANWPGADAVERAKEYSSSLQAAWGGAGADVLFISEVGSMLSIEAQKPLLCADCHTIFVGRFGVVSRVPVVRATPLIDDGKIAVSWVDFGPWEGNAPFAVMLVDLPSDPALSRRDVIGRMSVALRGRMSGDPDIVVGDFNVARGSGSVASLWPRHTEAFAAQGRGWGASFPRRLPLWHIDLMLTGGRVKIVDYSVRDPGAGKHSMQFASLIIGGAETAR